MTITSWIIPALTSTFATILPKSWQLCGEGGRNVLILRVFLLWKWRVTILFLLQGFALGLCLTQKFQRKYWVVYIFAQYSSLTARNDLSKFVAKVTWRYLVVLAAAVKYMVVHCFTSSVRFFCATFVLIATIHRWFEGRRWQRSSASERFRYILRICLRLCSNVKIFTFAIFVASFVLLGRDIEQKYKQLNIYIEIFGLDTILEQNLEAKAKL